MGGSVRTCAWRVWQHLRAQCKCSSRCQQQPAPSRPTPPRPAGRLRLGTRAHRRNGAERNRSRDMIVYNNLPLLACSSYSAARCDIGRLHARPSPFWSWRQLLALLLLTPQATSQRRLLGSATRRTSNEVQAAHMAMARQGLRWGVRKWQKKGRSECISCPRVPLGRTLSPLHAS